MSDFDDLLREVLALKRQVAELSFKLANQVKVGAVAEVDGAKGYRIDLGKDEDGKPVLSPWYPHPESGGALSTSFPLAKGQVVGIVNPSGDGRQGFLVRGGFSDQYKSPSTKTDENVAKFGKHTVTWDGEKIETAGGPKIFKVGGVTVSITESGLAITGGKVTHDGRSIGSDHKHGGVQRGGAQTDPPV